MLFSQFESTLKSLKSSQPLELKMFDCRNHLFQEGCWIALSAVGPDLLLWWPMLSHSYQLAAGTDCIYVLLLRAVTQLPQRRTKTFKRSQTWLQFCVFWSHDTSLHIQGTVILRFFLHTQAPINGILCSTQEFLSALTADRHRCCGADDNQSQIN